MLLNEGTYRKQYKNTWTPILMQPKCGQPLWLLGGGILCFSQALFKDSKLEKYPVE
jgi:hypothetical protein